MQAAQLDVEDIHCEIVFAGPKTALNLTVTPADVAQPRLGSMVYAVPRGNGAVTTTLVKNREFEEQTVLLAKLASSRFQRPVFLNSSVEASMFLYKKLIDAVEVVINVA